MQRLEGEIKPQADRIMHTLLQVLSTLPPKSSVPDIVFAAVGAVASALEEDFLKWWAAEEERIKTAQDASAASASSHKQSQPRKREKNKEHAGKDKPSRGSQGPRSKDDVQGKVQDKIKDRTSGEKGRANRKDGPSPQQTKRNS